MIYDNIILLADYADTTHKHVRLGYRYTYNFVIDKGYTQRIILYYDMPQIKIYLGN